MRLQITLLLASVVTSLLLAACSVNTSPEQAAVTEPSNTKRPNVLILYYDDMGYGDMGAYHQADSGISLTPSLDALARQSMVFTRGHSSDGVCTPSRYSLITGRYSWRGERKSGVTGGYSPSILSKDRFTIGEMFKQQGYTTAMVGKWHIGMSFAKSGVEISDEDIEAGTEFESDRYDFSKPVTDTPFHRGFDYWFGTSASLDMPPYTWIESQPHSNKVHVLTKGGYVENGKVIFDQARVANNKDFVQVDRVSGAMFRRQGPKDPDFAFADYLQVQAAKVLQLLAEYENTKEPFMIYIPMPAPHTPHAVQEQFSGTTRFLYGDYLAQTDYYSDQIIKALGDPDDPQSLAANTVVFISSDNGPENVAMRESLENDHDPNARLRGNKRDNWQGGTLVPFMVRWPGVANPGRTDQLVWQGDFIATMAEYLNITLGPQQAPDTQSFLSALTGKGESEKSRPGIISHSSRGQFAFIERTGRWKLVDGTGAAGNKTTWDQNNKIIPDARGVIGGKPKQLFDLVNDPGESDNLLVDDPANPDDNFDPTPEAIKKSEELYSQLVELRGADERGSDIYAE